MIKFFKYVSELAKAGFLWIKSSENRSIAFKYFKIGLEISKRASKITETKKDDVGVAYVAKKFNQATNLLALAEIKKIVNDINKDKSSLGEVELKLNSEDKNIKAKVGNTIAEYNPSNGNIKFGIKF